MGDICHIDSEQAMFMKSISINIFRLVVLANKEIQVQNTGIMHFNKIWPLEYNSHHVGNLQGAEVSV